VKELAAKSMAISAAYATRAALRFSPFSWQKKREKGNQGLFQNRAGEEAASAWKTKTISALSRPPRKMNENALK
jgi:hypothetical protein